MKRRKAVVVAVTFATALFFFIESAASSSDSCARCQSVVSVGACLPAHSLAYVCMYVRIFVRKRAPPQVSRRP